MDPFVPSNKKDRWLLGRGLVDLAKWLDLSTNEWAERAAVSRDAIYRIRRREYTPSLDTLFALFHALNLNVEVAKLALAALRLNKTTERFLRERLEFEGDLGLDRDYLERRHDLRRRIGEWIKAHRPRNRPTQLEVARRAGISQTIVSNVESGNYAGPDDAWYDYLHKIADALGLSNDTFSPTKEDLLPPQLRRKDV